MKSWRTRGHKWEMNIGSIISQPLQTLREKSATMINGNMKEAPRAKYYPDSRYRPRVITMNDIYDGQPIFKESVSKFAYKLYNHVTAVDPYVTQCGKLPTLIECFAVSDCLRSDNKYFLDFNGDLSGNMIQLYLELFTTGSEKKLMSFVNQIDKNEFEKYYSLVDGTDDVFFDQRNLNINKCKYDKDVIKNGYDKVCKYVIIKKTDSIVTCLELVGTQIESTNNNYSISENRNKNEYENSIDINCNCNELLDNINGAKLIEYDKKSNGNSIDNTIAMSKK